MQFLTIEESRAWAARHGYRLDDTADPRPTVDGGASRRFTVPADAGARVALARTLWEAVGQGSGDVLLWVTEWGVWPSGEHAPLAEAVRRGFGGEVPLVAAPGHVVRVGEDDAGLSILCLAALFLWDCWVLRADRRITVFVSHDEYGVVETKGDDGPLARRLGALGLLATAAPAT